MQCRAEAAPTGAALPRRVGWQVVAAHEAERVVALEILGSFSILRFGWVIIFTIAVGLGAAALGYWRAPDRGEEVKAPPVA